MLEHITAVMPTSGVGIRRQYTKVAIACFLRQTHPDKTLLILNHGDTLFSADNPCPSNVNEQLIQRPATLGELRNLAFEHVPAGQSLMTWDDDDWSHPSRMAIQLAGRNQAKKDACVLTRFLTVDMSTGAAFVRSCTHFKCGGCCSTILFRVSDLRYPAWERHEDSAFAQALLSRQQLEKLDNAATLYIRTVHGENVSGRDHILRRGRSRRPMTAADSKLLATVLADFADIGGITIPGITAQ